MPTNINTPMFQKALQKQGAKASMRGRLPRTDALLSKLMLSDMQRKQQFAQIGQAKKRADLSHRMRKFSMGQQKKRLDEEKAQLPWELGIGAGTALYSALEGRSRAQAIREAEARKEARYQSMMDSFADRKAKREFDKDIRSKLAVYPGGR